jgi:hypothetical protein
MEDSAAGTAPASSVEPLEELARQAEAPTPSLFVELRDFLLHNKKWWLAPILVTLILIGALLLGGSGAAPFIYTLF